MRSNKSTGTGPELILSKQLRKRLLKVNLPGRPDFAYRRQKVAVFVHGCFWHHCPECDLPYPKSNRGFWRRKFERNAERDKLVRLELEAMGWEVIEVWEHEVRDGPGGVTRRIKASLVARVPVTRRQPAQLPG
jgi:DNA mismatch endonuclease (patch repair protein)